MTRNCAASRDDLITIIAVYQRKVVLAEMREIFRSSHFRLLSVSTHG